MLNIEFDNYSKYQRLLTEYVENKEVKKDEECMVMIETIYHNKKEIDEKVLKIQEYIDAGYNIKLIDLTNVKCIEKLTIDISKLKLKQLELCNTENITIKSDKPLELKCLHLQNIPEENIQFEIDNITEALELLDANIKFNNDLVLNWLEIAGLTKFDIKISTLEGKIYNNCIKGKGKIKVWNKLITFLPVQKNSILYSDGSLFKKVDVECQCDVPKAGRTNALDSKCHYCCDDCKKKIEEDSRIK